MVSLKSYIKPLFTNHAEIDKDLQKILHKTLNDKYGFRGKIRNLKFAETASHVMLFNSRRTNSLCNSPFNAKIFSYINKSNISISLSTSKIKLNNPSSPLYLDFFGNLTRILPNEGYKNSYVYCLGKLDANQIEGYRKRLELAHMQHIVKNIEELAGSEFFNNRGSMDNPDFLKKYIIKNRESASLIERGIKFQKNIYERMMDDMSFSYFNSEHKDLADQINYVQSNLINEVFSSKIKHYYLSLEEVSSKLFLEKIDIKDNLISKLFSQEALRAKAWIFFDEPLFLRKNGLSLVPIDNKDVFSLVDIKNLRLQIVNGEVILNTKFSLFIISFYGLQVFGGRFQKIYMIDFIKNFQKLVKQIFSKKELVAKFINARIKQIIFLDIASLIIGNNSGVPFFNYEALLVSRYNLDKNLTALCRQGIDVIMNNTEKYLKTKK